jgi:hypothetical protein
MAHGPSGFVRAGADHPMDLKGTHALLRMIHEERDLEPFDQGILGVFEDRAGDDRKAIAVLIAGLAKPMERAGLDLPDLKISATGAVDAIGPTPLGEVSLAIGFGFELGKKLGEFHEQQYRVSPAWCQVPDNRPN